jgi:hypothetical protein
MQNVGFEAVFPAQKTNEKRTTEEVMGGKGEEKGTYQKEENGETFRSTRSDADTTRRVAGDALRNQMKVDLIQLIKAQRGSTTVRTSIIPGAARFTRRFFLLSLLVVPLARGASFAWCCYQ